MASGDPFSYCDVKEGNDTERDRQRNEMRRFRGQVKGRYDRFHHARQLYLSVPSETETGQSDIELEGRQTDRNPASSEYDP